MKVTLVIIDGSSISSTSMSFEYVIRGKILNNFRYTYNRGSTLASEIFAKNSLEWYRQFLANVPETKPERRLYV